MNMTTIFHHCVLILGLSGAALCLGALLAYLCRGMLRKLLDQWLGLNRLSQCLIIGFATVFVLYGSTKPPSTTNEPPPMVGCCLPPMVGCLPPATQSAPTLQTVEAWNIRGAWEDWHRIEFPYSFAFPHVTNMLYGVTVMSQGTIRGTLQNPEPVVSLPEPVAFEPGVSSFNYGLTASNTFLFVWQDVCINRDATNRVNASIELFETGEKIVRFGENETFIPVTPPPGFVGEGQDETWALAAFTNDAAVISAKGYEAWLTEDWVGINEENGRYAARITVSETPIGPCYLVCGPYKVIVTEPGTYCFPLEMCVSYHVQTYPESLALEIEYDDGFVFDDEPLLVHEYQSAAPRLLTSVNSHGPQEGYKITRWPEVMIRPNVLSYDEAMNRVITVFCNSAGITARRYTTLWGQIHLMFISSTQAEILEAMIQTEVEFIVNHPYGTSTAQLTIYPPIGSTYPIIYNQPVTNSIPSGNSQ